VEAAAGSSRPEILTQSPCRNVPLPRIEREEMRFLTPAEIVDLAEAIHARYRALVFVGAYGGLGIGELAGLRPSRVDLLAGAVTVAEILTEVRGKLITGPPKTRAGRRTVGLPPFVVRELKAHLAAAQRPSSHVFTAPDGGPLRVPSFRARFWVPATRAAGLQAYASTTFATPPWRCGSRRRDAHGDRRAGGAYLCQLHPGPLRLPDDPPAGRGGPVLSSKD
jgi:integrase